MSSQGGRRSRRSFSPQFKAEAVAMVVELDRTIVQVAGELGVHPGTLGRWVARWRVEHGQGSAAPLGPVDAARLAEAEEEIRRLGMENAFLKKAAAFFARELPQG